MNTNEYEHRCLAADKELAELLGWHRIITVCITDDMSYYDPDGFLIGDNPSDGKVRAILPRWTLDDAEAFRLMVEYNCYPRYEDTWHSIMVMENTFPIETDNIADAMRYAIVQAVINNLKGA